jgi:hypothetical protein
MHRILTLATVVIVVAMSALLTAQVPAPRQATARPPRQAPTPTPRTAPPALHRDLARAIETLPAGAKAIPTPPPGTWGIVAEGTGGGGLFRDGDSEAEAWLGVNSYGVIGYGSLAGGSFLDSDGTAVAYVAGAEYGIQALGVGVGAYFGSLGGTQSAFLAYNRPSGTDKGGDANPGEYGVYARGDKAGGYFEDADNSGYAYVGTGEAGIMGYGPAYGGYFKDSDGSGYAYLGWGDTGLYARGSSNGAQLEHIGGSGFANAAYDRASGLTDKGGVANHGEYGIYAGGSKAGAYFEDLDSPAYAYVANTDYGVYARGSYAGGSFADLDGTGFALIGYDRGSGTDKSGFPNDGEYGVYARGEFAGGYFEDSAQDGYAYVGIGNSGITAYGSSSGGHFGDTDGSFADVGYSTYKISGTGAVSFVQNHPYDPSSVIVYAAPEGDEVATYTRGTARLEGGEAHVSLGTTFRWVTNPDIGLTAFLTPVNDWCDLYVAEQATDAIVVRSRDGSDCTFNFMIYGLRIGFEESTIVQEKQREAQIPPMADHRELAARRPELAQYTALARWATQNEALGAFEALDLSRAHVLRDLIGEYEPAVHGSLTPFRFQDRGAGGPDDGTADVQAQTARREAARALATPEASEARGDGELPMELSAVRDVYARSFRPAAGDLASLLEVSEAVEPGDVLVVDPERPGMLRRAASASDPTVVGVVAGDPGVVLGSAGHGDGGRAAVTFSGIATCKVDATYGPVLPGDLLVSSPTPGHAMRTDVASAGTVLGKALEELTSGSATIRILVMPR